MDNNVTINIATDFSPFCAGRIAADGPNSGERFRQEVLLEEIDKAIASNRKVLIALNGIQSCGSSFLEEAFGGLVRKRMFTKSQINEVVQIINPEPHLVRFRDAILRHIENAKPE